MIKRFIYLIGIVLIMGIYLFVIIKNWNSIPFEEIIVLKISGVSMPYWLFIIFGFILMPTVFGLILQNIFSVVETKYFN